MPSNAANKRASKDVLDMWLKDGDKITIGGNPSIGTLATTDKRGQSGVRIDLQHVEGNKRRKAVRKPSNSSQRSSKGQRVHNFGITSP